MQTVEAMLVRNVAICPFLDKHLANLNIPIEGRIVNSVKFFIEGLLVDPLLDDVRIPVLLYTFYALLHYLEKAPENHRLVFYSRLMKQSDTLVVSNLPYLNTFR